MADLGLYEKVESSLNIAEIFYVLLIVMVLCEIGFVRHYWQISSCLSCVFYFYFYLPRQCQYMNFGFLQEI